VWGVGSGVRGAKERVRCIHSKDVVYGVRVAVI
jgi:hypothetical protein